MTDKIYAVAKNVRIAPRKARLVVDLVRGENAEEASEKLKFVNKKAALHVRKVIDSAVANAINNFDKDAKNLFIKEARVDEGYTLKRGRAVSKGRYHRILKRNSHIVIGLTEKSE
ncbi:50S ribosomal protein L22 [Candidatus Dojkabacteria bacterium]|nr:50S ribosomal protein L22 [Candidatus Dojkabacteria bacterium]